MKERILMLLSIAALLMVFSQSISCSTSSSAQIAAMSGNGGAPPAVGNQAPSIAVNNLSGRTVSLSDFKGKKVLVSFWSVECGECDRDMWLFQAVYKKYPGVQIMAINPKEDVGQIKPFISSSNFTFPVYVDQTGLAAGTYDVHIMPKTFLIDGNGTIKYIQAGPFDNQAQLESVLNSF